MKQIERIKFDSLSKQEIINILRLRVSDTIFNIKKVNGNELKKYAIRDSIEEDVELYEYLCVYPFIKWNVKEMRKLNGICTKDKSKFDHIIKIEFIDYKEIEYIYPLHEAILNV
jgi:hypothetical protein